METKKISNSDDIKNSKHFCILPWIHSHVMPNSEVIPCCNSDMFDAYGDLKKENLIDIWNNERFSQLRKTLVQDLPHSNCERCYSLEKNGIQTLRKHSNERFAHCTEDLEKMNSQTGRMPKLTMKYFDMRFSNTCNFKCRGCSPEYSSRWTEDYEKLFDVKPNVPKSMSILSNNKQLWADITDTIETMETAYFAGGEPLMMEDHYLFLNELINRKKTNINLFYNTNLSILHFKQFNLIEKWKNFPWVRLSVSIDDIEKRGEYFRNGTEWEVLFKNLKTLKKEFSNVASSTVNSTKLELTVNCTVSVFNIHRIPELHQLLFENQIIDSRGLDFNTLTGPPFYCAQILPSELKLKTKNKLLDYISWLKEKYVTENWEQLAAGIMSQIDFMYQRDESQYLPKFKHVTQKLDIIRGENFSETYPELSDLLK